jgi:hypothetical protein
MVCLRPRRGLVTPYVSRVFKKTPLDSVALRARFEFTPRTRPKPVDKTAFELLVHSALQELKDIIGSIDRRALAEPPAELWQFAKEETFYQQGGQERRRFRRYSLITNVIVVPLDERLCPVTNPFVSLSSGMSVDGIRLLHTDPTPSDQLLIEIESQPVRFVLSVLRSCSVGGCFEIAGRFMDGALVKSKMASPAFATARCNALDRVDLDPGADLDLGTLDRSLPTFDEFAHWAGVSAAVQLLRADSIR